MNAQQVIDKILAEAQAEAAKIRQEAQARTEAETARIEAEIEQFGRDTQARAEQAAVAAKDQILAAARMENRRAYLTTRVRLLDEVFERARRKINSLPDKEYRELMKSVVTRAVETGQEQIVLGRAEKRIDEAFVREVNAELGSKGKLTIAERRVDIDGGLLLERGKIRVNSSTEVLIGQARDRLELELSRDLFAAESGKKSK
ncbi:MAG TPA: V-type ATP synthase subunit E [Sedimentisphaerales bacterium]|nr:V-type ATP synthase subunit E [Sedimentisphaerales bacterium]